MAGLVVLVACGGSGGVEDGVSGGGVRVVDLVEEDRETTLDSVSADRDRGFDPLVTPSASGVDLVRLREVVDSLVDPVGCPQVEDVESLEDVVEVLRLVDGCLVLEYVVLDGRSVQEVAAGYETDSGVLAIARPLLIAVDSNHLDDPEAVNQLHLVALEAEKLWAGWPPGAEVRVAVIDTGVDGAHHDLDDNLVMWGDDANLRDGNGHGSHVAGIIAAEAGNGIGGAGVAPEASLISIRFSEFEPAVGVAGPDQQSFRTLAGTIAEARRSGARVVNMSIHMQEDSGWRADALPDWCGEQSALYCGDPAAWQLRAGQAEGMIFVASAGNCGPNKVANCKYVDQIQWPAAYEGVIGVGSVDLHDLRSLFSTAAPHVDIAAPGQHIVSTLPGNGFGIFRWNRDRTGTTSGTSMAAPMVTAVIAHLLARFPDATYEEITDALYQTARHVDLFGNPLTITRSNELGWGVVQPLDAIQHLHNSRTPVTTAPATTTAVTTTTTAVPTTTAAPATTAAAGDRIAYVSDRDGDYEIYIHDLDTGQVEQITDNTRHDLRPVWSPDGDRIAYVNDGLYVYDLDTGHVEQITDSTSREPWPVWFPDGDRIAYVSDGLYVYDLDTGHVEQIIDNARVDGRPVWSPDGDRIAYVSDGLYVYDFGIGHVEQINDPDDGWVTGQPVWSPDGGRIAYQSGWEGGRVIYVYDVGTGGVEGIPWSGHSWDPVWSPDGGRIAYVNRWDVRWDADGEFIVPGSERYGHYVYDLGTGRVEQITDNASDDGRPVWAPDGGSIAYVSDLDGDPEIFVHDFDTGRVEQITDNASRDEQPVWAPDSGSIAYVSDLDGDPEIFVHDFDTGRVEQITDNASRDEQPVWAPDGGRTADTNDPAGE